MKTNQKKPDIYLDGSKGEGGGQILRSALSLSAITGKSFQLDKIRAGRQRPGLMRQHLTCVQAVAAICDASTSEARVGAASLSFFPEGIKPCRDTFAIGTAGSTALLLQTILPVLWYADAESEVVLQGGTHAMKAPCFEYIDEIFLPQIRKMGGRAEVRLRQPGFFPAGGGEICLKTGPSAPCPVHIHWREKEVEVSAEVLSTPEIPAIVAEKELREVGKRIPLQKENARVLPSAPCPGNVLLLRASAGPEECPGTLVGVSGEKNKRSEQVAKEAAREMKRYLNSPAPVDEHLADQLLLPLALAGGGGYTAAALTSHFHSNVEVIELFLPATITTQQIDRFAWKVAIESSP